ncbi:hypothetical protein [Actinacidiphila rubida]|nr:hypothetical protein [Actinacidiphila rubida]
MGMTQTRRAARIEPRTTTAARTAKATADAAADATADAAATAAPHGPGAAAGGEGAGGTRRGAAAAFVRFVLCGGGVSLLSSGVLLALGGRMPFAVANALVTVAGTLLATELHHRFTFGTAGPGGAGGGTPGVPGVAGGLGVGDDRGIRRVQGVWDSRAGWRIHAKSAVTLAAAYLVTTAAVIALGAVHPRPGPLLAQAVYLAAAGLAGAGRFLVLRFIVFAGFARKADTGRPAAPGTALRRGEVTVAA